MGCKLGIADSQPLMYKLCFKYEGGDKVLSYPAGFGRTQASFCSDTADADCEKQKV